MARMYNPAHPGEVLREYLGEVSVTEASSNGISADMALRLEAALGASA